MLRKISIIATMVIVASFFPSFIKFSTCRYCIWTIAGAQSGGLYNKEWSKNEPVGFYFYGNLFEFRAGYNDKKINALQITDPYRDFNWIRVRLGIPHKGITIDKMENVNDWHMHFEGVFWFNFILWIMILPFALEFILRMEGAFTRRFISKNP